MKIGVISDTHLTHSTPDLAELMSGPFQDAEMILHAGDITELGVLDAFAGRKVLAVCGNMDSPAVRKQLPAHQIFQAEKFRIALIHGWGRPQGIEERIAREVEGVDCIIYGHTHTPAHTERQGVFFFNPGSFGGGRGPGPKSVGVLNLGSAVSGQVFYL